MKPSPGPWTWDKSRTDEFCSLSSYVNPVIDIDGVDPNGNYLAVNEDDAALIAVAPEMREMLLELEPFSGHCLKRLGGDPPSKKCPADGQRCSACKLAALVEKLR